MVRTKTLLCDDNLDRNLSPFTQPWLPRTSLGFPTVQLGSLLNLIKVLINMTYSFATDYNGSLNDHDPNNNRRQIHFGIFYPIIFRIHHDQRDKHNKQSFVYHIEFD